VCAGGESVPGRRAGIILVSLLSRLARAFELRVTDMELDATAERFVRDAATRRIRFIANEPDNRDPAEYRDKIHQIRTDNDIPATEDLIFVEVSVRDPSDLLRMDRRQPLRPVPAVLPLRPGRGRTRHQRSAPRGRARPDPPTTRPRRLSLGRPLTTSMDRVRGMSGPMSPVEPSV
jgi:hypothetical protein